MLKDDLLRTITTKNIKIGTIDGSGFFYCGPTKDFIMDLDKWEKSLYDQLMYAKKLSTKQLATAIATLPTPEEYAKKMIREKMQPFCLTLQGYLNLMQDGFERVNRCKKKLDTANLNLRTRKDLRKRRIKEIRDADKIVDTDATIVIIEGMEPGGYWTIKEFEEGTNGEDNEGGTGKDGSVAEASE